MDKIELKKHIENFLPVVHALLEQAEAGDKNAQNSLVFLFSTLLTNELAEDK